MHGIPFVAFITYCCVGRFLLFLHSYHHCYQPKGYGEGVFSLFWWLWLYGISSRRHAYQTCFVSNLRPYWVLLDHSTQWFRHQQPNQDDKCVVDKCWLYSTRKRARKSRAGFGITCKDPGLSIRQKLQGLSKKSLDDLNSNENFTSSLRSQLTNERMF